jgi:hypothetical protein
MRHVSRQTLDEDAEQAGQEAIATLRANEMANHLPELAHDTEMLKYVVKGSDKQWEKVLQDKDVSGTGTVQISEVREKRKIVDDDDIDHEAKTEDKVNKTKGSKKQKNTKKKSRR